MGQRFRLSSVLGLTYTWPMADQLDAGGDKTARPSSSSKLFQLVHMAETGPGGRVDAQEASWGLGLALGCCHFCHILLAKINHKANLSSRLRETFYSWREEVKSHMQKDMDTGRSKELGPFLYSIQKGVFHAWSHLIPLTTLGKSCYYDPHFTGEKTAV